MGYTPDRHTEQAHTPTVRSPLLTGTACSAPRRTSSSTTSPAGAPKLNKPNRLTTTLILATT